jgi:hypothetical protein
LGDSKNTLRSFDERRKWRVSRSGSKR